MSLMTRLKSMPSAVKSRSAIKVEASIFDFAFLLSFLDQDDLDENQNKKTWTATSIKKQKQLD